MVAVRPRPRRPWRQRRARSGAVGDTGVPQAEERRRGKTARTGQPPVRELRFVLMAPRRRCPLVGRRVEWRLSALDSPKSPQLEVLVRQYGRLISSVVRRITGAAADLVGDDIEQKVLLSLWRQIESEQKIDHPSSYIYRIAIREAVRAIRQETSRGRRHVTDTRSGGAAGRAAGPLRERARREQREHIEASLAELRPERERAVRAHLAGFAVQEIMEMQSGPTKRRAT